MFEFWKPPSLEIFLEFFSSHSHTSKATRTSRQRLNWFPTQPLTVRVSVVAPQLNRRNAHEIPWLSSLNPCSVPHWFRALQRSFRCPRVLSWHGLDLPIHWLNLSARILSGRIFDADRDKHKHFKYFIKAWKTLTKDRDLCKRVTINQSCERKSLLGSPYFSTGLHCPSNKNSNHASSSIQSWRRTKW